MQPRVYIETSVFSAYVDDRNLRVSILQQEETRRWWIRRDSFDLFSSAVALSELGRGVYGGQAQAIQMCRGLPFLPITRDVVDLAAVYARHMIMPGGESQDSVHLALASIHRMDFLLTWNCRHLANANKIARIRLVNEGLGLVVPVLLIPTML